MTDQFLASNIFIFFVAGFETTAALLSFCLFELGQNLEVQEKLYEDVVRVMKSHGGKITYDSLKEMTYLKNCLSETLRLHPSVLNTTRTCTKDYKIPDSDLCLKEGQKIWVPICALHVDPNLFENPYKFIPERFDEKNKHKIKKGSYIPFGAGPRICIGMKFAWVSAKVALTMMILNYKFLPHPKTKTPLKYDAKAPLVLMPDSGTLWLSLEKRTPVAF